MKILFLILISFSASAQHYMKVSELEACKSGEPVSLYSPKYLCGEDCIEWPRGASCKEVDIVDEEVLEERWSGKFNRTPCESKDACQELLTTLCEEGKEPFYAEVEGQLEAYCAFKLTPELVKTGRKLFKVDEVKRQQLLAEREAKNQEKEVKRLRKEEAKEKLKLADVDKITTVKQLKEVVLEIKELLQE